MRRRGPRCRALPCLLALAVAGCAHGGPGATREIVWSGEVRIGAREVLPAGAVLVIRPGTRVLFEPFDEDGDGRGDAGISIQGSVNAVGESGRQIVFAAAPGNRMGWGEVRVEEGARARFRRCSFADAQSAVHAHRTPLEIEECEFRGNGVAVRFTGGPVTVSRSRFRGNGTAVRFWESAPRVLDNEFEGNATAVFVREGAAGVRIAGNDFRASEDYHLKLGELQAADVDARGNWWGTASEEQIERLIYDREDVRYLGRVHYRPCAPAPLRRAGEAAGAGGDGG